MRRRIGSMIVVLVATLFISALAIAQGQGQGQGALTTLQAQHDTDVADLQGQIDTIDLYDHPWEQFGADIVYNPDGVVDNGDEVVVDSNGNVGIGTTIPQSLLHISSKRGIEAELTLQGDNSDAIITLRDGHGDGTPIVRYQNSSGEAAFAVGVDFNDSNKFKISKGAFLDFPRLIIDSSGNVGIGTTSPIGIVDVVDASPGGTISTTPLGFKVNNNYDAVVLEGTGEIVGMTLASGRTGNSLISFADEDDALAGFVQYIHLDDKLHLGSGTFARVTVDGSGNVGIGTPSPSYPLEMGSGAHVTVGGVWTDASSRNYKENIKELTYDNAFMTLQNLTPVTYNYKVDKEETCVGFIAEDVPDLVATKDRKSLSPMDIVAVLTKVLQKQQEEIVQLKSEKEILRENVSALTARQDTLETMFLALSTTLTKEKLVKYNQAGLDEVQKAIQ